MNIPSAAIPFTSKEHARSRGRKPVRKFVRLGRESSSRARYEIKEKAPRASRGWRVSPGAPGAHPRRRALCRGVLSPTRAYSALKLGTHPQSCAVSTHRPMKAPRACKLVAHQFQLSRPSHSDQTPRGTRPSCTCIRGAARARCARENGRLRGRACERSERRCLAAENGRARSLFFVQSDATPFSSSSSFFLHSSSFPNLPLYRLRPPSLLS